MSTWAKILFERDERHHEKRAARRYGLILDTRWRLIRRRRVVATGTGKTIDLSSGGILLEAEHQWLTGCDVELAIAWPATRHLEHRLELLVSGRIVRASGHQAALRIRQHEFRELGTPAIHRKPSPTGSYLASRST